MVGSDFTFTMNVKDNDKPKSSESSSKSQSTKTGKRAKILNTKIQNLENDLQEQVE